MILVDGASSQTAYNAVKYWLPLVSVALVVFRVLVWIRNKINATIASTAAWGERLLHNHLLHIQTATEESVVILKEVRDNQSEQLDKAKVTAAAVEKVAVDLEKHENAEGEVQQKILTALEILKDRT